MESGYQANDYSSENQDQPVDKKEYYLSFYGDGARYLGIVIVNVILTILTLGLYYPWAKAKVRQYLWNETELDGSRFVFHGTGKEMFRGFIIAYGIFILLYAILMIGTYYGFVAWAGLIFYVGLLILVPFALYGGWRYRISRTSWRGIRMSFDGDFREFLKMYFKDFFLTLITLGIYGFWMRAHITQFLFDRTKIGHIRLGFTGTGSELFGVMFGGYLLTVFTAGICFPIWMKWRFEYTVNNTYMTDGEYRQKCISHLSNGEAYGVMIVNLLLIIVTLGLAFPWVMMRTMRMYINNIDLPEIFDLDELVQSNDEDYDDATGDDLLDIFDLGLDF